MDIARSKKRLSISQQKYVFDLLKENGILGSKPNHTPIETEKKVESDKKPIDKEMYQKLVRKLIYLSYARPNIAFAVNIVSQHMHSSKEDHLKVVYMVLTVLKYLKISSEKDFSSVKQERKIEVFYDVEWVRLINDMRSTNEYSTFV